MTQPARHDPPPPRAASSGSKPRAVESDEPTAEERAASLRESFWKWGRVLFIVAAFYVVVQLLGMIGGVVSAVISVFLYVVFGGIIALVVAPLASLLRRALPQTLSALLALLTGVAVIAALAYFVGQPIVGQANDLARAVPKLEQPFLQLQRVLAQHGINVSLGAVASVLGIKVSSSSTGTVLISAVGFTVRLLIDLLITLVAAFWLLADGARLRRGLLTLLPGRWRTEVDFVINAFSVVFGGYIRGQLVLAALVGTLAGVGCWLLGVPFPLVVGVGAGVFELIPLAGPFVGAGIAVVFALTVSPPLALEVIGLFAVIHIIEGYIISPRIQARFVQLHPLVTLLALLAGVGAGGFLGAFFAVPLASLIAVIAKAGIADLRAAQPDLFLVPEDDQAARGRRRNLLAQYRMNPTAWIQRMGRRVSGRNPPADAAAERPAHH